ncbi:MAG: hypothetical protein V3T77_07985, partial [Planctomycetota bacterium]
MDRETTWQSLLAQGRRCVEMGEVEPALAVFKRLRMELEKEGATLAAAEVEFEVALAEYSRRNPEGYQQAAAVLSNLLENAQQEWQTLRARAHHLLGVIALRRWNADNAGQHLDRALEELGEDSQAALRAQIYDSCGQLEEFRGNTTRAVSAYSCSMALKASIEDRYGLGITLNNLGRLHCKLEEWEAARRILQTRMELAEELQDMRGVIVSGPMLALALARSGAMEDALKRLKGFEKQARK